MALIDLVQGVWSAAAVDPSSFLEWDYLKGLGAAKLAMRTRS